MGKRTARVTEVFFGMDDMGVSPIRAHFVMPDDSVSQSSDIWREPPLPDDLELRERRLRLKFLLFKRAFTMPGWDVATQGPSPIPFYELPPESVQLMPDKLRCEYEAERAAAADPRSGPRLVPCVGRAAVES